MKITRPLFLFLTLISLVQCKSRVDSYKINIVVGIEEGVKAQFKTTGRLFLFLNKSDQREPRKQIWPNNNNYIFAKNYENWNPVQPITVDIEEGWIKTTKLDLQSFPKGTYYVQIVWDQQNEESRIDEPGNLYSEVKKIRIAGGLDLDLKLSEVIPPRTLVDHELVKEVNLESKLLSAFLQRSYTLKASVLLPRTYFDQPDKKYPVRYNIAGYGGRYTRINRIFERDPAFIKWWMSAEAPEIINVFLDGEGPFGDSYQLDSENSGPFGQALTEELIPHIESTYRGIGTPESRFLDGCSTGGWVSLALQVYYPDFFNGTWSYSPDAIEFENYQLINIYQDTNAFYNEWGKLRPVARDTTGEPRLTMKEFIQYENVLGTSNTYLNSGGQFSAHTALYSPKGKDGLPAPLFDPKTGKVDPQVATHWKKYDMKLHLKENWPELGTKLQGKIWIWMGDMDNFYLNLATRAMDDFLKQTTNPKSDAKVVFTPQAGHCDAFDHKEVLMMMAERIRREKI